MQPWQAWIGRRRDRRPIRAPAKLDRSTDRDWPLMTRLILEFGIRLFYLLKDRIEVYITVYSNQIGLQVL